MAALVEAVAQALQEAESRPARLSKIEVITA